MVQTPSDRLKSYWPRTASDEQRDEESQAASPAWSEQSAKYLGERPIVTLAVAVLVGLTVGWMVKRK